MLRWLAPLLALTLGCHAARVDVPLAIESAVLGLAPSGAAVTVPPEPASPPTTVERLDLETLWGLALAHNPSLREAAADVEAARGRLVQAGLYPNPRAVYNQDTIGSRLAPQGNISVVVNQEIVTAGKRRLDQAVAGQETAASALGLVGRKFDVLTRVRRAHHDYLTLRYLLHVHGENVATLERGVEITRRQVEKTETRPRTDLLRLEALLAEARINQARARDNLQGAWRQLAAEVGLPGLLPPREVGPPREVVPHWQAGVVLQRVLGASSVVRQARTEVDRAALAVQRAKAGAVPNVIVGAGYNADNTDQTAGAVLNVETALPLWNRQQGAIHEAQARLAAAHAAVRSAETRLTRDTAEAFARYQAARRQVEGLATEVLPQLERSLGLLLKAYQAGSAQVTFSDVLITEQSLNSTRLTMAEARRSLWLAVADLQGLMQLDVGEEGD
jgi:cobalt-zinc-cadmium efflux system outer membrane protein